MQQLQSYVPRILNRGGGALVTLSQASKALADIQLPAELHGVPVVHMSWREVLSHLREASRSQRGQEAALAR